MRGHADVHQDDVGPQLRARARSPRRRRPPRRRPRGRPASRGTAGSRSGRAPGRRRSAAGCSRVTSRPAAAPRRGSRRPPGARSRARRRAGRPARACRRVPCPVRSTACRGVVGVPSSTTSSSRRASRNASVTVTRVGSRVLEHVRQRLLDDAVDRELDAAGQRLRLADHLQSHRQSGVAVARDQLVELGERRLRARLAPSARARAAARGSAAARPGSARRWSRRGRACRRHVGRGAQHVARAAHADQHHADRVGDDVVQLAGDRRPLLVDGDPGQLLALALGVGRALLELAPVATPRLGVGAEPPDADRPARRR